MDTAESDDEVERLECLGGVQNGWAETTYVEPDMEEEVKLWFVEPLCSPKCGGCEKVTDCILETFLASTYVTGPSFSVVEQCSPDMQCDRE